MISFESKGSFQNTDRFLKKMAKRDIYSTLKAYGEAGVNALSNATPVSTGKTADSWEYEIVKKRSSYSIIWSNTNVVNGKPIAILLQYGHGTGTGGFVQGRDYINPAIRPIFDKIAADVWKEVTSA
jgi:hypothetical protein